MEKLFLNLFNISITACWFILAILLFRLIFRKAPKFILPVLWGLVAIRLIIPFNIESSLSLVPSAETIPEKVLTGPSFDINSGIEIIDNNINGYLDDRYFEGVTVPTENGLNTMRILSLIWVIGISLMFIYAFVSCIRIKSRINESVKTEANIYICDRISAPFIFGIIKPQIYLPSILPQNDRQYVIAHENAHIKRLDYLWKPLGFLILSVYWFNPLIWVAYIFFCRDIESACDQKVLKQMGSKIKKAYAEALINCNAPRKMLTVSPLAFGETGVKNRIKAILSYKKPVFWVIILAIITAVAVAAAFLTNPREDIDIDNILIVEGEDNHGATTIKVNKDDKAELILKEVVTKGESPYVKAVLKNRSDDMLCYGEKITLYRNDKEIKISEGYGWDDILNILQPNNETEIKINLDGFDVSKSGYYKLEKEFYFEGSPQEKFFLFINFSVAKDGSTESKTQSKPKENQNPYFEATVIEIYENSVLVEPDQEYYDSVGDSVTVSTDIISKNPLPDLKKGHKIRVVYNGEILYTYPAIINDVFAIYLLDQEEVAYYKPLLSFGIESAELLERDVTTTQLRYTSKASFTETGITAKFENYLNDKFCEEKSEGNWVKFNPARPNNYAFALHLENGETMLLNIHFSQNSSSYYIALGEVNGEFDISADYSDIPCKRYVANEEFGEFLQSLIS